MNITQDEFDESFKEKRQKSNEIKRQWRFRIIKLRFFGNKHQPPIIVGILLWDLQYISRGTIRKSLKKIRKKHRLTNSIQENSETLI